MLAYFYQALAFDNPVRYAIPVFILLIILEAGLSRAYPDHHAPDAVGSKANYEWRDTLASLSMGLGSVFFDLLAKSVALMVFFAIYQNTGWFKDSLSWTPLGWALLFFADDFTFYWHHRLSHQVRVLWAAHVNHHSSEHYNLSTALRQSWTEIFYKYSWFCWLPLVGFHPLMILTQMSINLIYQFWIHTRHINRLPAWIEFIFNTPSHHRVHHGSNPLYIDRNHGGTLIIWDRLFGTFQIEDPKEPVVYGITQNIHTFNPVKIASHEYAAIWRDLRSARSWGDRFKHLFYPPGWKRTDP